MAQEKEVHSVNQTFQKYVKPYFQGLTMKEWMEKNKADYQKYYDSTETPSKFEDWLYRRHVVIASKINKKLQEQQGVNGEGEAGNDKPENTDLTPKPYAKWIGVGIMLSLAAGIIYLLASDTKK